MTDQSSISLLLFVWIGVVGFIIYRKRSTGSRAIGLAMMYIINLALIHWFGAGIYILPWHDPLYPGEDVESGFKISTYGVVAFGAGVAVLAPLLMKFVGSHHLQKSKSQRDERVASIYIAIALCCYFILLPLLKDVPTLAAFINTGWTLVVIGLSLKLWGAWERRNWKTFLLWNCSIICLPFLSVISEGFLGFGTISAISILIFVAGFYRPRWHLLVFTVVVGYLGLSIYVTYMRDRYTIRDSVYLEESYSIRYDKIAAMVSDPEPFSINNNDHLHRIDGRLNMNYLVGAAVGRIESGTKELAYGSTLWDALIALVPRAIWPEKPVFAGSGDLVTQFTGYHFTENTSVGVGQVMEFYINFGLAGVVVGFLVLGLIIGLIDEYAGVRLEEGNWRAFSVWFIVGIAFLQAGGSLVEVISTAGVSLACALLVNKIIPKKGGDQTMDTTAPDDRQSLLPLQRQPYQLRDGG